MTVCDVKRLDPRLKPSFGSLFLFPESFQIFALLPWADIIELARRIGLDSSAEPADVSPEDVVGVDPALGLEDHCNPKFPKTCQMP